MSGYEQFRTGLIQLTKQNNPANGPSFMPQHLQPVAQDSLRNSVLGGATIQRST